MRRQRILAFTPWQIPFHSLPPVISAVLGDTARGLAYAQVYPELAAILAAEGYGNRMPDHRGLFKRGYGAQPIGNTNHSSGPLGQAQIDQIRPITGMSGNIVGTDSDTSRVTTGAHYRGNSQGFLPYASGTRWPIWQAGFDSALLDPNYSARKTARRIPPSATSCGACGSSVCGHFRHSVQRQV